DWFLTGGTPVLAVAPGRIVFAGPGPSFTCTIPGSREFLPTVVQFTPKVVRIEHQVSTPAEVLRVRTTYRYLSRLDVQVGQQVMPGDQVGRSGSRCDNTPDL